MIARPKYNFGIAVEKFGQAFFAIYKILWILTSLASTLEKTKNGIFNCVTPKALREKLRPAPKIVREMF